MAWHSDLGPISPTVPAPRGRGRPWTGHHQRCFAHGLVAHKDHLATLGPGGLMLYMWLQKTWKNMLKHVTVHSVHHTFMWRVICYPGIKKWCIYSSWRNDVHTAHERLGHRWGHLGNLDPRFSEIHTLNLGTDISGEVHQHSDPFFWCPISDGGNRGMKFMVNYVGFRGFWSTSDCVLNSLGARNFQDILLLVVVPLVQWW